MTRPPLALDRAGFTAPSSLFRRALRLERQYAQRLRKVARHVGDIVSGFDLLSPVGAGLVQTALRRYADVLDPWARQVGERMVAEVAASDDTSWRKLSKTIGQSLGQEIRSAPTGLATREAIERQVGLIKSLPLEAAERVQRLVVEGLSQGLRAEAIAKDILATGEVTKARANLIARTEVSRAATELTKARAKAIGSDGYVWRTAGDSDVRHSHRQMSGKFVRWDDPPTLDGLTGHAGGLPNCRCWTEPVIPD